MKLAYPCRIKQKDELYKITFRDIKGFCSECVSYEDALETAEEILSSRLEAMIEEDEPINPPSPPRKDEVLIPVRPETAAKIT